MLFVQTFEESDEERFLGKRLVVEEQLDSGELDGGEVRGTLATWHSVTLDTVTLPHCTLLHCHTGNLSHCHTVIISPCLPRWMWSWRCMASPGQDPSGATA